MAPPAREGVRGSTLGAVALAFVGVVLGLPGGDEATLVGIACRRPVTLEGRLICDDDPLPPSCGDETIEVGAVLVPGPGCVAATGRMAPDDLQALGAAIDVNRASADDLTSLPGVGPTTAMRIIEARPFAAVEGLLEVKGIGPARLAAMRDRVALAPVLRRP